jgi:predicted nucleotidyltransferase
MCLDAELHRILDLLAPCTEKIRCLKAIYVFGSLARGDAHSGSDLDLMFEYIDNLELDNEAMKSFTHFQRHIEVRKILLGEIIGRPVSRHGAVHDYRGEDGAWPAIRDAARHPVVTRGKIIVAATPRTKPLPV